jgi:hypothetical protein
MYGTNTEVNAVSAHLQYSLVSDLMPGWPEVTRPSFVLSLRAVIGRALASRSYQQATYSFLILHLPKHHGRGVPSAKSNVGVRLRLRIPLAGSKLGTIGGR